MDWIGYIYLLVGVTPAVPLFVGAAVASALAVAVRGGQGPSVAHTTLLVFGFFGSQYAIWAAFLDDDVPLNLWTLGSFIVAGGVLSLICAAAEIALRGPDSAQVSAGSDTPQESEEAL
ncbi:hypothetical protein G7Y31_01790 [Corynebacterium lizhenjunii]|uniref:Uncharacterized protein n=1 Tax=Corynebacterium lizhenjunii TaxID=2709394 RepID=A0A7T0KFA7_9CORY|nr:hypothetical protein [Corynebacterium lizhenjunii]QPK79469.1 hypothetical protein G7Y31_01790 [Corynebacterium lizhenjunii]